MRKLLGLCLLVCGIACATALAQGDSDEISTARASLGVNMRGDLSVSIFADDDLSATALDTIRATALACNWRPRYKSSGLLEGTCRHFFQSDGASVSGRLDAARLVTLLHAARAEQVTVFLDGLTELQAPPPPGWRQPKAVRRAAHARDAGMYSFVSAGPSELPPPFDFKLGQPWEARRLVTPLLFTLFAPPILSLGLMRRSRRNQVTHATTVWMHWVLLGAWLYWISAVRISDLTAFAVHLQIDSLALTLAVGAVLYSVPPLLAMASCIVILIPAEKEPLQERIKIAKKGTARNAAIIVPFGIFLVGSKMFQLDTRVAMASIFAAYVAYRVLTLFAGLSTLGSVLYLSGGELAESVRRIAGRAKVQLKGVYLTGNRSAREANAFAGGSGFIMLTGGLVESLTCREVDTVVAHEMGHLRGKDALMSMAAFWGYILVVTPAAVSFVHRAGLPGWLLSLPILPMGYVLGTAFLSRSREFEADRKAAELTGDPEGMIAALARLRMLSDTPVDWGGMQGSILSHPSMHQRAMAIARRFNLAEERALAILNDPGMLGAEPLHAAESFRAAEPVPGAEPLPAAKSLPSATVDGPPADPPPLHYALPEFAHGEPLFSTSTKETFEFWVRWLSNVSLVAELMAVAIVASRVWPWGPHWQVLAMLLCVPVVARTYLAVGRWFECRFARRIRRRLLLRLGSAAENGIFAGVSPGDKVVPVEGFSMWDVGFLFLSPDWLTYQGEQARFSIPRSAVSGIEVRKGPFGWSRTYAATVTWEGGSFSVVRPDRGVSRRTARRLKAQLDAWRQGLPEQYVAAAPGPFSAPSLPQFSGTLLRRWAALRSHALRAAMLFLGVIFVLPLEMVHHAAMIALVPFTVPMCYLMAVCPLFFARPAKA
jgi:Zn-dependent protease with chaperone function